jgi:hypothetical protein
MDIKYSTSEFYYSKEISFTATDINGIEHPFCLIVQREKDNPVGNLYYTSTCASSDEISTAVELGKDLEKFFDEKNVAYILESNQAGLDYFKNKEWEQNLSSAEKDR